MPAGARAVLALPCLAVALALVLAIGGCASSIAGVTKGVLDKVLEPDPTSITLDFVASSDLNPSGDGRPAPLSVRIYGLASPGRFEVADFFELYDTDEQVLGNDIELREEFSFAPGERQDIERELNDRTRYIAVMAAYRDIAGAVWRASVALEPNEATDLELLMNADGIVLQVKP